MAVGNLNYDLCQAMLDPLLHAMDEQHGATPTTPL